MNRMVVIGDSYMRRDPDYPGQHWSEMMDGYEVIPMAVSGASIGIILYQFWRALREVTPDCMVIGLTAEDRIEFDVQGGDFPRDGVPFVTNRLVSHITGEQKDLATLFAVHTSAQMMRMRAYTLAASMFMTLRSLKIDFAWTPGLLDSNLAASRSNTQIWRQILGEFEPRKTPANPATHQKQTGKPEFHVDDPGWQAHFAQQVMTILDKS